jgi:hypothetical protein
MKIAFHSNQLGVRGTEIALYDYAYYNREILGNESVIISDKHADLAALSKFQDEFEVFLYDNFSEVIEFVAQRGIEGIYYQKSGQQDGKLVPGIHNMVHTVFQFNQPHGEVYSFISPWLAEKMTGNRDNAVPYIVDILKHDHDQNYREILGIPEEATVFGYYGGPTSFNIEFARQAVRDVAYNNPHIFFLFMNSEPFCDLPNVRFIEATTDYAKKIGFINTCDACIHARNGGESFGLTVAEFSSKNKPVITTTYCTEALCDMAHIEMLGDKAVLYNNYEELVGILTNFSNIKDIKQDLIQQLSAVFQQNEGDKQVDFEVVETEIVKRTIETVAAPMPIPSAELTDDESEAEDEIIEVETDNEEEVAMEITKTEVEEIRKITSLEMNSRKLKVKISKELLEQLEKLQVKFKLN